MARDEPTRRGMIVAMTGPIQSRSTAPSLNHGILPLSMEARRAQPRTVGVAPMRLTTGLAALGAFVVLAEGVRRRRLRGLDVAVRRAARPRRDRRLTELARDVCTFGEPRIHPLIAGVIAAVAAPRIGRRALRIPAASIVAMVLDRAVRYPVQQRRPPGAGHHPGRDRYAFPSGHTTATTAIALTTVIELDDTLTPAARGALITGAVLASTVMGVSRIYLDEHWADDVIGGWILGAGIACTLTAVMPDV